MIEAQKILNGPRARHPSSAPPGNRFPPPWSIKEANNACFIVHDSTGQALGYFILKRSLAGARAAKLLATTNP